MAELELKMAMPSMAALVQFLDLLSDETNNEQFKLKREVWPAYSHWGASHGVFQGHGLLPQPPSGGPSKRCNSPCTGIVLASLGTQAPWVPGLASVAKRGRPGVQRSSNLCYSAPDLASFQQPLTSTPPLPHLLPTTWNA